MSIVEKQNDLDEKKEKENVKKNSDILKRLHDQSSKYPETLKKDVKKPLEVNTTLK